MGGESLFPFPRSSNVNRDLIFKMIRTCGPLTEEMETKFKEMFPNSTGNCNSSRLSAYSSCRISGALHFSLALLSMPLRRDFIGSGDQNCF